MINKAAIFAGAIGGVAPTFLRLVVSSPSPQLTINVPYCLALAGSLAVLAILGGVVVWIFQETDLKRAFYLGIGLPSLLQVATLQSQLSPNPHDVAPPPAGTHASISLVSSAYAQTSSPTGTSAIGRKLNLTGDANAPEAVVLFYGEDNKWISTKPVSREVDVPQTAAKFAIQVRQSISPSYAIPATTNAEINATVKINEKAVSGFLHGIGLAKAYDITVQFQ